MADAETLEALERAERRRRVMVIGLIVMAILIALTYLFVPRTVASGHLEDGRWELRMAPIAVGSEVSLVGDPAEGIGPTRVARTGGLDETVVWRLGRPAVEPNEDPAELGATVVVGPTPSGVDSVRVTSDLGVGEARIVRVGWRRYHVDQLPGHVDVSEFVAIDADGRPIEVSERSEPPADDS